MTPASNAIKWYLLLVSVAPLALATSYNYITEYSGKTFFDEWNYFNNVDNLTNGDVLFLDRSAAAAQKLTYVNDAGNAIMKVDNSSTISVGDKRNSIRIVSKDRVNVGSVWIADFLHVPYGCSTWPAFWSTGPSWPSGGEIDTFEGINNNTRNTMTLHTEPGCVQRNAIQTSKLVNSTDCSYLLNGNQGCSVTDHETSSYGEAFHKAGGGLFVTEFAEKGISIWFFNRSSIPSELSAEDLSSFDTSNLGTPAANWPNTGCNMAQYFKPQNLIMDITLCGDDAGAASVFAQTCPGNCYIDWVTGPPSNYDNAYFEIKSIKIFGSGENTVIRAATPASSAKVNYPFTWIGSTIFTSSMLATVLMQTGSLRVLTIW